jgi:signal transduction histidine kinase
LPIQGDRDLIQQAVANLLDNALKFSPPEGEVKLGARATRTGVEIVVTDQGPGIPAADRARATERFYRAEAARSTPGSGLGLALVQAVAQLHGGGVLLSDAAPGLRAMLTLARGDDNISRDDGRTIGQDAHGVLTHELVGTVGVGREP